MRNYIVKLAKEYFLCRNKEGYWWLSKNRRDAVLLPLEEAVKNAKLHSVQPPNDSTLEFSHETPNRNDFRRNG